MTNFPSGLYVVATPIGNLADLSRRAAEVLNAATLVAAEDTRTTGVLLKSAGSRAPLVSLTEHNVVARTPRILEAARTGVTALVSDAGTPLIADPGARLVEAAHAGAVPVYAVPGPSAVAAAVSVAGFEGSDFHFLGFLARKAGARAAQLREAAEHASVFVFFESPARLGQSLKAVAEVLHDPETVVCRELTKVYEEAVRGRASELASRFAATRGECTVVVRAPAREVAGEAEVRRYMAEMARAGARRSAAAAEAAGRFGLARSKAYALWPGEG
ncbi:MAG: 16S rRNA (cytidine(1402)-2'-O)-methyltransferase [Dehalococcoidia bacterium]